MSPPPLKAGTVLDPNSDYAKAWTGMPSLTKLKDRNLILQMPPQFSAFWNPLYIKNVVNPPVPLDKIPVLDLVGFNMFMPDFSGYTPENYKQAPEYGQPLNEDLIQVVSIQAAPMSYMELNAPGNYPPNMFARMSTGSPPFLDPTKYEEKYGLRCYAVKPNSPLNQQWCYGLRDKKSNEYILMYVDVPPYQDWIKYPIMQTTYFTKQYGGLAITWRAHAKQFPHWHEIDQQIWKYIGAWNIAPDTTTSN
ncbi:MAG: hypothetical protein NVS3B3_15290 [Aquirhabdus sp.]